MKPNQRYLPIAALLLGSLSWGILWYPFRLMEAGGLPAPVATLVAYALAALLGAIIFGSARREFLSLANAKWFIGIALAAGITNVSYLVSIMQTEVVRIVLLFYLAPLWTIPLAWLILRERLTLSGYAVMALAMCGAVVMLWRPELGLPAPRNGYEWLGLVAGVAFASVNVLVKGASHISAEAKSLAVSCGVTIVALPVAILMKPQLGLWPTMLAPHVLLLLLIGIVLMTTSFTLQYGLSRMAANRAAVILLFELIVAAVAAHYLADETTRMQDWIGGVMIVAAGLLAAWFEAKTT